MLFFDRGPSQSIYLSLAEDVDPTIPIGELFKDGPIRVRVMSLSGTQVRISVRAPLLLDVYREGGVEGISRVSAGRPTSANATASSSKRIRVEASP